MAYHYALSSKTPMSVALIDVLISVYNGAKTVRSSIESIQRQTVQDIRIIVVDDGSTDDTLVILNEIAQKDSRVQVIPKPHSGIVDSLNKGLALCTAEFIARFDADDIAYPHRFATQVAYLQENPGCIAVSAAYIHIDENDHQIGLKQKQPAVVKADATWIPCLEPFLMQTLLMMRKADIDAVNGYRLCEVSEDSDLYWRLYEIGEMHNIDEILGAYRLNPNSISSKSIINGRRMALWSQLAGISSLRRRNGETDLTFDKERIMSYQNAVSLEEICRLASKELTEKELVRLRIAASVKMLELTAFRPYELDREDCRFIQKSLIEGKGLLNKKNHKLIKANIVSSGMRLMRAGKNVETYLLVKQLLPYVIFMAILRSLIPKYMRNFLKTLLVDRSINRFTD
ncbi:conserved hypothetical protein [Candidatus Methylobacter favarea]|uniref:Glycosyltransferase 2-like domain-containing protein n=1 Tax=Candidatus Methylobacter favarea TaxID=2707345 RepID=A0A8S0WH09_9GAMM|nr:glycosyltransferase [Candidatus Methylobacter favarea]CAA9889489.1 conserved hypothetical protein [Candidatus Methylobacter favarea]